MFISVQFSHSVGSDSLRPHRVQHARPPCPCPTPRAGSNSCPLSRWCHPTISSSVIPFSSCLQFSQHQGRYQWVSSSDQVAKVLELQLQHQSLQWISGTDFLRLTGLILQSKGLSKVFSNNTVQKHQFFGAQVSLRSNSHIHTWQLEKTIALTRWTFVGKVMSLLLNMLSRLTLIQLASNHTGT